MAMTTKCRRAVPMLSLMRIFLLAFLSIVFCWYIFSYRTNEFTPAGTLNIGNRVRSKQGLPSLIEGNPKKLTHQEDYPLIFRKMTIREIHDRFRKRTADTCINKCSPLETMCDVSTKIGWIQYNKAHNLSVLDLYHENEIVFPWEEDFFSKPRLTDVKTLPDLNKSVIRLLINGVIQTSKKVTCELDEMLTFRLDLYDSYGRARDSGNDEVRAWISGSSKDHPEKNYRAVGQVVDMKNGSYDIRIKCLWLGYIQLKVGVVYPKEYLRLAFHHDRIGSYKYLTGHFKRGNAQEDTICSGLPNVPGRPCICNYTHLNLLPFYCSKPLDSGLSCNDLMATSPLGNTPRIDLTPAEKVANKEMSRNASQSVVRHQIEIKVVMSSSSFGEMSSSSSKCSNSLIAQTWSKGYPRGFFDNENKWNSLICKEQSFDISKAANCLRNTNVLLIGDSNMKQLFGSWRDLVLCTHNITMGDKRPGWSVPSICRNESMDFSIHLRPHVYPINEARLFSELQFNGGLAKAIDLIPSHGKHIVLYHYFLHPSLSHSSTTFLGLNNAKEAIIRLLRRNPQVLVGVRGPHVAYVEMQTNHFLGGDILGSFTYAMYKSVFRELWDRVVFLDGWELTTAMENPNLHPPSYVPDALLRTFLSFFCDSSVP